MDNFRLRIWHAALEKAGVAALRLHDLRHTYISVRIKRGEDLAEISQQAGYANLRITLETHAHFIPSLGLDLPPL